MLQVNLDNITKCNKNKLYIYILPIKYIGHL